MVVGTDPLAGVERDACLLEPDAGHERGTPDRDEHQVGLDGLAVAVAHGQGAARLLDGGALLAELERDPLLAESLGQLLGGVVVLLRDQAIEHLDHRHLAPERPEDRGELAADDPAAENGDPGRHLRLGKEPGRVDAELRVEARDRRPDRERARRDDRRGELDILPALH